MKWIISFLLAIIFLSAIVECQIKWNENTIGHRGKRSAEKMAEQTDDVDEETARIVLPPSLLQLIRGKGKRAVPGTNAAEEMKEHIDDVDEETARIVLPPVLLQFIRKQGKRALPGKIAAEEMTEQTDDVDEEIPRMPKSGSHSLRKYLNRRKGKRASPGTNAAEQTDDVYQEIPRIASPWINTFRVLKKKLGKRALPGENAAETMTEDDVYQEIPRIASPGKGKFTPSDLIKILKGGLG